MEEGVKPVVDPSLLTDIKLIDPTQEFLFGLGEPWEPEPWEPEAGDVKNTDEDCVFIAQVVDQVVEESSLCQNHLVSAGISVDPLDIIFLLVQLLDYAGVRV